MYTSNWLNDFEHLKKWAEANRLCDTRGLEAAKTLKAYCEERHCEECVFYNNDDCDCVLKGTSPNDYPLI